MTVRAPTPPTTEQLRKIASGYGFHFDEADLEAFRGLIEVVINTSYQQIDQLAEMEPPPVKYPRSSGYRPEPEENPLNAWYWKCSIKGADTGPLSDKRIAMKDNICVAGIPMMNGSATVEGYTPEFDATVVTRILDAGGEIVGKVVCEDLCFSGGSHTSYTGPVLNPHDNSRMAGGSSSGGGGGRLRHGHGRRPGRFDPRTERLVRHLRAQADLRAGPVYRRLPHRAHPRPHRADGDERHRHRPSAGGHRRRGRSRPAPEERPGRAVQRSLERQPRRGSYRHARRGLRLAGSLRGRRGPDRARFGRHTRGSRRTGNRRRLRPVAPRRHAPLERDRGRRRPQVDVPG